MLDARPGDDPDERLDQRGVQRVHDGRELGGGPEGDAAGRLLRRRRGGIFASRGRSGGGRCRLGSGRLFPAAAVLCHRRPSCFSASATALRSRHHSGPDDVHPVAAGVVQLGQLDKLLDLLSPSPGNDRRRERRRGRADGGPRRVRQKGAVRVADDGRQRAVVVEEESEALAAERGDEGVEALEEVGVLELCFVVEREGELG